MIDAITTMKRCAVGLFRWMCRRVGLALLVASVPALAASDGQRERLVLTGSSTIAPLAADLAQRFEQLHPDVEIDVQSGGSSRGMADARNGLADIGMVSRALRPGESDLHAYTIALDGITIITHRDNPVKAMSRDQIVDIYTDRVNNWSVVGGPDAPITVVNKAEGRSTLELFLAFFGMKGSDIKADVVIGDNQQGLKTVAGNPWAIGYVSIGSAEYEAAQGLPIRLMPLDGVQASISTVKAGQFPLARPLNLVTKAPAAGIARAFIDFATSEAARDIVEHHYFIAHDRQ